MLNRPSHRRKTSTEPIQLNLVPMLDALVTMIAFLLFTMSFLTLVAIESPVPVTSKAINNEVMKEKPLQLTLTIRDKEVEIWSPFEKIKAQVIPHLEPGKPNVSAIHDSLFKVKQQFPAETKIVFAPESSVNYDELVSVMDAARVLETTDGPIALKNPKTGVDEVVKDLFPEIVFGNLLGES